MTDYPYKTKMKVKDWNFDVHHWFNSIPSDDWCRIGQMNDRIYNADRDCFEYGYSYNVYSFKNEKDALAFKLKFLCE